MKSCPAILNKLRWKTESLSASWGRVDVTEARVGRPRAVQVMKAMLGDKFVRPPRPGWTLNLGKCGGYLYELENCAGRYVVTKVEREA